MRTTLGFVACLLPIAAHATRYTLADSNGVPSCDIVAVAPHQQLIYGDIYFSECNPPAPTLAGSGVSTKIPGSSDKVWSFAVTATDATSLYIFDFKALTWVEYYEANKQPLQIIGNGLLLKGVHKPPVSARVR
jgi:hypothetical protein